MNYERIYQYRFNGIDLRKKAAVWREIATKVYGFMGRPQRVLDPAGGQLEFIDQIPAPEKWVVDLVKYDSVAAKKDLNFVVGNIFDVDLPKGHFDGIFISNFLEHLATPADISRLLEKLYSVMAPGGRIAIMGPNFKYATSSYFDCADHILPLSHVAVAEHVYASGFELRRVIPKFVPYSFRGLLPPSAVLARLYLKMPFVWPILGKQFLIVGQKK
jgi:ubiquinone/menaquinone biosynthesis C-methylase UbiE